MMIRALVAFVLLVGSAALVAAGLPEAVPEIPNYKQIEPGLATGGRPSPQALARLKQMGFQTVIDLRTEAEGTAEERTAVEGQGLRYVNVPVSGPTLGMAEAAAVQKALDDPAAGPVLLHCASSNRVGAVYALVQSRRGKSAEQALLAGRAAGLSSPALVERVRQALGLPPETPTAAPAPPSVKP